MQIYADVTGRSWRVAASPQTPALGSAMFAAVAAGPAGRRLRDDRGRGRADGPPARRGLRADRGEPPVYDRLYAEYVRLHDLFGRGADPAMKTLKRLRLEALSSAGDTDPVVPVEPAAVAVAGQEPEPRPTAADSLPA